MKKILKGKVSRVISLVVALLMTATVCLTTGCSNKKEASSDKLTFTYWCPISAASLSSIQSYNEMTIYKELEKKTGIHIEFIHPTPGQELEQFNLMLASGDLPDFIEYPVKAYPGGADKAIEDGVIISLNDYIGENTPNLSKILNENSDFDKAIKTDSGNYIGFPYINDGAYQSFGGLLIRQDWLDDLGLPMPETIADWENVLTQFKEKKGAKSPFTCDNIFGMDKKPTFQNGFDASSWLYVDDKEVKYGVLEPGFKDYIATLHDWYKKGLIDSEFDTNNSSVVDAKITTGEAGATFGFIGGAIGKYEAAMKDKDPKYALAMAPYPTNAKGDKVRFMNYSGAVTNTFLMITSACKDPEKAVEWADFWYSEEGDALRNFGVEGLTYTKDGDNYIYTDEILNNPDNLSIAEALSKHCRANEGAIGLAQNEQYLKQYYQLDTQKKAMEQLSSQFNPLVAESFMPNISLTTKESDEITSISSEIKTYVEEMMVKFIKGTESLDNFDSFIKNLKKLEVDKYVKIHQNAYDRYLKR